MTDLLSRLSNRSREDLDELCAEAAREIERLRAENDSLRRSLKEADKALRAWQDEAEQWHMREEPL